MSTLYKIRNRAAAQGGFSLIELLVVVLIIGILATIMIPRFIGQRDTANNSSAKSNLRNAASAAESQYQINGEDFGSQAAVVTAISTSEPGLTPKATATDGCNAGTSTSASCSPGSGALPAYIFVSDYVAGKTGSIKLCNVSKGNAAFCITLNGGGSATYAYGTALNASNVLTGSVSNWNK